MMYRTSVIGLHVVVLEHDGAESARRFAAATPAPPRREIVLIEGSRCRTKSALLTEWGRALSFPDYFGRNWDALDECLDDLDWLGAEQISVVVSEAADLMAEEQDQVPVFLSILSTTLGYAYDPTATLEMSNKILREVLLVVASDSKDRLQRALASNCIEVRERID